MSGSKNHISTFSVLLKRVEHAMFLMFGGSAGGGL